MNTFKLITPNPFMHVMKLLNFSKTLTLSKYGVISDPYFHVFGLHTEIYEVNLHIESEYRKIRTRNNSVFGHFSRSVIGLLPLYNYTHTHVHIYLQEPGFAPHILLSWRYDINDQESKKTFCVLNCLSKEYFIPILWKLIPNSWHCPIRT